MTHKSLDSMTHQCFFQTQHFENQIKVQVFENNTILVLSKLQKHNFVKPVTSCARALLVQSIGMCAVVFLYKVTLPTTGLGCIIQDVCHFRGSM